VTQTGRASNQSERPVRVLLGGMTAWQAGLLVDVLTTEGALIIVGAAGDCAHTIAQAVALAPDVVLLNLGGLGSRGLEAVRQLRTAAPGSQVLLLANAEADVYYTAAQAAGATYLPWLTEPLILMATLRKLGHASRYTPPGTEAAPPSEW
jgi:DNA-binding NarL/FixJ family response regulator